MKRSMLILALILLAGPILAAVPSVMSYQGKLMQPSGVPVPDGTYSIQFAIYDVPTGGSSVWSETNANVQVKGGLFSVLLGSVINLPANIFDSSDRWFGVRVGSDPEMTPRQKIASVGYAIKAGSSDIATTVPDSSLTGAKIAAATVTADKLAVGVAIPPGGVIMWSGAANSIPQGWALCNGQNGTPDLRGRFVVGVGAGTYSAPPTGIPFSYAQGDTGGEVMHQLTVPEMPSHRHDTANSADCGENITSRFAFLSTCTGNKSGFGPNDNMITLTGGNQPHENRPPYYALCFIMKLGY